MRIAKIFVGEPNNRKGFFNNVIERTECLLQLESSVDCFIIRGYYGFFFKLLKFDFTPQEKTKYTLINNVRYNYIWLKLSFLDYILTYKFRLGSVRGKRMLLHMSKNFKNYQILSVHGVEAIFLASCLKKSYDVPFVAYWHGSEINYLPFYNSITRKEIRSFLDDADCNFFVSKKLMNTAEIISPFSKKEVLYTGPSKLFKPLNERDISRIKLKYGLNSKYVVGFVGNLKKVKNVLMLPHIFKLLQTYYDYDISFIIIGDGKERAKIFNLLNKLKIRKFLFLGNLPPNQIPDILGSINVIVLPSFNEGLPRVALEAQVCGVHVVGSDRGGIPEAIGECNCFPIDSNFSINVSKHIINLLDGLICKPTLPVQFDTNKAVLREISIIKNIVEYDLHKS